MGKGEWDTDEIDILEEGKYRCNFELLRPNLFHQSLNLEYALSLQK